MERERPASRRSYSAQLKALVLEQCAAPGVSVAKVAMAHGINANVVHRWRQLEREGAAVRPMSVGEFVPVSVSADTPVLAAVNFRVNLVSASSQAH